MFMFYINTYLSIPIAVHPDIHVKAKYPNIHIPIRLCICTRTYMYIYIYVHMCVFIFTNGVSTSTAAERRRLIMCHHKQLDTSRHVALFTPLYEAGFMLLSQAWLEVAMGFMVIPCRAYCSILRAPKVPEASRTMKASQPGSQLERTQWPW